jgi:FHA domain
MDPLAIRWISLAFVLALVALAIWAFADAARMPQAPQGDAPQAPGPPEVAVHRPGRSVEVVPVTDGAVLGRSRECRIVLDDATVSKEHARLRVEGASVFIEDLDSTNGTLVNGKAIEGPTLLQRGDRIGLGRNVIVFASQTEAGET